MECLWELCYIRRFIQSRYSTSPKVKKYLLKTVSVTDCRLTFKLYSNYLFTMQRKSILCSFKLVKVFYEE
ncbi:hypothetical protein KsCSTR_38860 [Candidatus Kuenenia stuttgartiensis]|uniref:Uncharacterized protein n=1 Tax=Kuenenia stuttgartiensis TaxID=174633 RepID=Q1PUQ7_KUEST|nr:hypothetical protein KsCSTR_38860 [Candidatus Kuenenia stuttgartiensis]TVL95303.1 MAG: hypothetical protein CV080_11685 [Candidatus Kuenenia stuttgartiensis]CAJ70956.1 unknown protein [Candidatus Kuenenia stuttgartiensis]